MYETYLLEMMLEGRLFWKDPDPIKGNNYQVTMIKYDENISLIHYDDGSEAEVFNNELYVTPEVITTK